MSPAEEAETVRQHQPFILRHAVRAARTSNREIDDCVQDASIAFVQALRKWSPEGGANIRTFATPALQASAMNAWRARNRMKEQRIELRLDAEIDPFGDSTDTLHDTLGTPATQEEDVDAKQVAAVLRQAIDRLPHRARTIIRLRFFEGETLEQVGERLDLTKERVRQIEDEALDKLCLLLVQRGVSE